MSQGSWETFTTTLKPTGEAKDDFASPYSIDGGKTSSKFVVFTFDLNGYLPEPKSTEITLEARLDGSDEWQLLLPFTLHLVHMRTPEKYITYRNSPEPCLDDVEQTLATRKKGYSHLEAHW